MNFRDWKNNPKVTIVAGMVFLLLGSLALIESLPSPVPHNDGFTGFLYGVSIGCLVVGLKQRKASGR